MVIFDYQKLFDGVKCQFQYRKFISISIYTLSFLEIVPVFEVLFMELIWHISGELIMYKILRGRWIWSVCFAPPFNVLLSNAEWFRVRLLRNTRANNFSVAILTFISRSDGGGGGRAPVERTPKFNIYSRHT